MLIVGKVAKQFVFNRVQTRQLYNDNVSCITLSLQLTEDKYITETNQEPHATMYDFELNISPQFIQGQQILPKPGFDYTNVTSYLYQVNNYISKNPGNIYSLNLSGFQLQEQDVEIIKTISKLPIMEIDLSYTNTFIYQILRWFPSIKSLILIQSQLQNEFDKIFQIPFKQLKYLNLSNNILTQKQLTLLFGKQQGAIQPNILILSDCQLTNETFSHVCMSNFQYLQALDLSENHFEDLTIVEKILSQCHKLSVFQFRNNSSNYNYMGLFNYLNVDIESLDFSGSLDEENAMGLAQKLQLFLMLKQLKIRNCNLNLISIQNFTSLLDNLRYLNFLDIRNTGIDKQTIEEYKQNHRQLCILQ